MKDFFDDSGCGCFIASCVIVGIAFIAMNISGYQPSSHNFSSYKNNVYTTPAPKTNNTTYPNYSSSQTQSHTPIYEEPVQSSSHSFTPDDAYDEGYENGYEHGKYDGLRGKSHGYSYDDSNDYYNYYESRYLEGYESGYDEGYYSGYSDYEDGEGEED